MLKIEDINVYYGNIHALKGVSLDINEGEIVTLIGANGAGKSTTMKMITGYLQPTSGTVVVCDIKVNDDPMGSKQKIGYLPESNALYYDMYVREYLAFIAEVHQIENRKSKIENVIQQVGLTPEAHKKIGQLSKGYKQRVGLAAALIHDPEVLILDEPTSGLDPNQIIEIRDVIKQLGLNKTVLFSSHILQEVQAICDRVIIINKGTIVADDQLSHLLKKVHAGEVILELKEEVDEPLFNSIQNCIRINSTTWKFKTDNPDAVKKQLLQLSIEKNLNVLSLKNDDNSLEDVFRSLTN